VSSEQVTRVSADKISVRRYPSAAIAVVGNPNSGKSTLFNRLTGLHQKTGNYPGVTVERHVGTVKLDDAVLELIDLPGMFALSAHSLEERIASDVVMGRIPDMERPAAIVAVVDTTHLYQGLYLVQQLMELELPLMVALTMTDAAQASGIRIDIEALQRRLGGIPVCPVVATTGQGMNALREELAKLPQAGKPQLPTFWAELQGASEELAQDLPATVPRVEIERALIDVNSELAEEVTTYLGEGGAERLESIRKRIFGSAPPLANEARHRYAWVRDVLKEVQHSAPAITTWGSRVARFTNRPVPGTIGLFVVMAIVFQAVFAWATPMMDAIEAGAATLGIFLSATLPEGAFSSFLADGVVAGVGSVIVFLPQIMILFLFIIVLEDSGYLARAAYLMDRVMRSVGLSGWVQAYCFEVRVCRARHHGDSRHSEPSRPHRHHTGGTVHDLFRETARLCAPDCRIRSRARRRLVQPAGHRTVRTLHARYRGRTDDRVDAAQDRLARTQTDVCVDAAGVQATKHADGADPVARTSDDFPEAGGHRHLRGRRRRMGVGLLPEIG
jgi:ferrous iron transport protein B